MREIELKSARGGMLYDPSRVGKPGDHLFSRDHWRGGGGLEERVGGRGSVLHLRAGEQRWVWRHYRRGGLVARALGDRYLYTGASRTRGYREYRLLTSLVELGLPVPVPIAARYTRSGGFFYRADLITVELPPAGTLADTITGQELATERWQAVGATIARFHGAGVQHADLNAHNVLLTADTSAVAEGAIFLLDFDRGRIRERGPWESDVLARLQRSLEKIATQRADVCYRAEHWASLRDGYERALDTAAATSVAVKQRP